MAQPYQYRRRELLEPDWRRLPGWRDVTAAQWRDAQWQRAHCVKNVRQLRAVVGDGLPEKFYDDLAEDQEHMATMAMLVTPHLLNTMAPETAADCEAYGDAFYADPIRRYMIPVRSDRDPRWPSHPLSSRDSLHEAEMWVVEGLTSRYPTKVLAELVSTCPQYCGHCTRMDLVGGSTPRVDKQRLLLRPTDRQDAILDHLRRTPGVRDVVVSGGDVANVPWPQLESFLMRLLEIDSVRDVRLATKALVGLPQHWLQSKVVAGLERVATAAARRGVHLAVHTHANHAASVTPLVAEATRALLDAGVRDVRNQGVLMRGVNDTAEALLDLCFALQDEAGILPYYFYMCDMVPGAEHWRTSLAQAQELQHAIMGYLPGYATPRIVCDVPYVGKRWVHQAVEYDRERGVSYWTKNYRTRVELDDPDVLTRRYPFYDPLSTLPESGWRWWEKKVTAPERQACA
ncbi:lysine 2,3-aminomutase [Streptomyces venezuelae]|uniref:Lysine 2,3-aminomutase n=1 Tax=Streptomyces venezuelae TaxID=54571 RepID=A0A5P2DBV0_STRVZ|nr:lysine 2,3-aminomutase [Streptomyces venezuelae]